MKLTDELLLKYAEGDLDKDLAASVEQALPQDALASGRLRLIRLSGAALNAEASQKNALPEMAALAQSILVGDLDQHVATNDKENIPPTPMATSTRWSGMQMGASVAILLIGLGTGYFARDLGPNRVTGQQAYPTWLVRVVDYHTLYVRETVAAGPAKTPNKADLKSRFAAILGQSVTIPDLGAEQLEFRRGQYLKFEDSPIIQLAYLPKNTGKPVALCFKTAEGPDNKPTFSQISGLGVIRWHQSGLDYVLVGDLPEQRLRAAANNALAQIDQGKST